MNKKPAIVKYLGETNENLIHGKQYPTDKIVLTLILTTDGVDGTSVISVSTSNCSLTVCLVKKTHMAWQT